MDISEMDASITLTAIFEDEEAGTIAPQSELVTQCTSAQAIEKEETPDADLKSQFQDELSKLCVPGDNLSRFVDMHKREKVIVDVEHICDLISTNCQVKGCSGKPSVDNMKVEGAVLTLVWNCSNGHSGVWHSSCLLGKQRNQNVFATTVGAGAGVLISGNNFEKIQMMKFLNVHFVSESTFNRMQSLYVIPAIRELWDHMKRKTWEVLKDTPLVLSGDGRNDSPGHSAKFCVYTLMEQFLDVIVDVEVVDVRETGGVSSTMERLGLRRLIERTMKELKIKETVTDASAMIIKLLRDLKGSLLPFFTCNCLLPN